MAFDASIIIVRRQPLERVLAHLMRATNDTLLTHGIFVARSDVSVTEFTDNTSSREINKYIRIRRDVQENQNKAAYQLIKVGSGRYEAFEQFASVKYASVSVSKLGNDVVVWYSFHSKLYRAFREFEQFSYTLGSTLSAQLSCEVGVMRATTASRSADDFVYYHGGRERHRIDGKGGMTEVRRVYGLDINTVMDNVEMNVAIFYGPTDFVQVQEEIRQQKERHSAFMAQMSSETIEHKETHENMVKAFEAENRDIMYHLEQRFDLVSRAFTAEPIGTIVFFKMDDVQKIVDPVLQAERQFG